MNYSLIIAALIIFIIWHISIKVKFISLRYYAKKQRARVVEYRKEKVRIRNDYTKINYPFVILLSDEDQRIRKLRYANSWKKPFKIGDEIDVFYNGGELLYWHAYDKGLYKFLPGSWTPWKKESD